MCTSTKLIDQAALLNHNMGVTGEGADACGGLVRGGLV